MQVQRSVDKQVLDMARDLRAIESGQAQVGLDRLVLGVAIERQVSNGEGVREVARTLGWAKSKMSKVRGAARELEEVMPHHKEGAPAPSVSALYLLHTERRRQEAGTGRVTRRKFRALEKRVANGMPTRDLEGLLWEKAA